MITSYLRRGWNRAALLALGTVVSLGAVQGALLRGSPADERGVIAAASQAFATFTYITSRPATPACDFPPSIQEAALIEIPAGLAHCSESRAPRRLVVQVDATGAVTHVSPPKDTESSELAAFLARSLAAWRFNPLLQKGTPTAAEFTLDFAVQDLPATIAHASGKPISPPALMYRIAPAHPAVFTSPVAVRTVDPRENLASNRDIRRPEHDRLLPSPRPADHTEAVDLPWLKGAVTLRFKVGSDGRPQDIRLMESSCAHLDAEAYSAVRYWMYRPMHAEGKPSASMLNEIVWFPVLGGFSMPEFIRPPTRQPKGAQRWDEPPAYLRLALPVYPEDLVRRGTEGNATVEVQLAEDGRVLEARPRDSDRPEFGLALQAAVFASSFTPARKDGRAIPAAFPLFAKFSRDHDNVYTGRVRLPALRLAYEGQPEPVPAEDLDQPARVLIGTEPFFHRSEAQSPEPANVELELIVDPTGRVRSPRAINASRPEFGYAAVQACATWLFDPPTIRGKPAAARVRITLADSQTAPGSP